MSGNPGQFGIAGRAIKIANSVVTGHGIDLASRLLRVLDVSCDRSRRFGRDGLVAGTWEVCAND